MRAFRPFDMSKFRKEQNKTLKIKDGFFDPITWIDTGNFALNKMISNRFDGGVPIGSVSGFAGESGAGKSYVVSGNIVRNALLQDVAVVILDSENAVKKEWATKLGVPVDHLNLIRWSKNTINEVAKTVSDFMEDDYLPSMGNLPREEQSPVLFILDSLGNLETETGIEQFEKGDLKGDKGIFAKQAKMMFKNIMRKFDGYQVGMVFTNHTYKNQNMYSDHEDIISGGGGQVYISDILVSMNKAKLKLDVEGNKISNVRGIRSTMKCVKSRYAKPFEEVEVLIPYDTGMDPYSGLFDMFKNNGTLLKEGNKWLYASKETGKEYKMFEKEIKNDHVMMDMMMREYTDDGKVPVGVDETPEEADVE
jgi:RecA/RadA recombinase